MSYKDNFSQQAQSYAKFRPRYPQALYDFILKNVSERNLAWDCATGNGQVATELAPHFTKVIATDASAAQIGQAQAMPNIEYLVAKADQTPLEDNSVDLITVGQALHWFAGEPFYSEVRRVAKSGALLICFAYGLFKCDQELYDILERLYADILGDAYWDPERKYIEKSYSTIPFPFDEIAVPYFIMEFSWDYDTLLGYLHSWSAVQKYIKAHQSNPIELIEADLKKYWSNPQETKTVRWEIFGKMAKIEK